MSSKYDPLSHYLCGLPSTINQITFSFAEVERIMGAKLPESAMNHRPWWGNQKQSLSRPQAHAWLSAGFEVDTVKRDGANSSVRFRRAISQ